MCHTIYRCHPDWLEDNMPSSVVLWRSLCHHIIFGTGIWQQRAWLGPCHSIWLTALWLWWDLLIMLMESKNPSEHPHPVSLPHQCPPMKKWPWTKKRKPDTLSQHIWCETWCLHLVCANLLLKSSHYQFHWGQDNWLRIWFSQSKHDYGVAWWMSANADLLPVVEAGIQSKRNYW